MNVEYVGEPVDSIKKGDTVRYKVNTTSTYLVVEADGELGIASLETGSVYWGLPTDLLKKVKSKVVVEDRA